MGRTLTLSGSRLQQQLSSEHTNDTLRGTIWAAMSIPVCWTKVGEKLSTGPDWVRETCENVNLIQKRLLKTQSRLKSYAGRWRKPLEFEVRNHVFFKVMPKRGVVRFGKQGKLSPRYIGPFEVLEKVGTISYRLALSPSLSSVYTIFHVSMLRKYTPDLTHVVD